MTKKGRMNLEKENELKKKTGNKEGVEI